MVSSWQGRFIFGLAILWLLACGSESAADSGAAAPGRRRAVLIGIDDYSASHISSPAASGFQRRVRNLEGTVNDVRAIRKSLLDQYGFGERDIVTLTNQEATREAIFRAIDQHLLKPARKGDVLLFYFSGHGSQVVNSLSDEPDRFDESIVPADTRQGAQDIRDKELRRLFNQILDQGALLTVILDSCHSGSGARVPSAGALFRGVQRDRRDVRDGTSYGPRPEDRGALVLAATQDYDLAWETQGPDGLAHGAFSLALVYAMRTPTKGESAEETFLRARARLQAEKRFQEPVLAGVSSVRRAPLLGGGPNQAPVRTTVAVERVEPGGAVILQGGWADGLTTGSELRLLGSGLRLKITEVTDLTRCRARLVEPSQRSASKALQEGMLAEVVAWAAPPGEPLRVYMPKISSLDPAVELARQLAQEAPRNGVQWIEDPTERTPTHLLLWQDQGWELLDTQGNVERLGLAPQAGAVLRKLSARPAALFVQIPAPNALVQGFILGAGTDHSGVEPTNQRQDAEFVLTGRLSGGRPEYTWMRSAASPEEQRRSGLPLRTTWQPLGACGASGHFRESGQALENALLRLRKIHAWQHLSSPLGTGWGYELTVRRKGTDTSVANDTPLLGKEIYNLLLRTKGNSPQASSERRYVYVFVIDSYGRSVLLYPLSGSVENLLPGSQDVPERSGAPVEISLGRNASFRASEPYGVDTYFLLTSDEPLQNPWILEWDGVRTRGPKGSTPLEELLSVTGGSTRAPQPVIVPANWSLERKLIETVPPTDGAGEAD